ncbi:MAG: hypothetical protein J0L64_26435 [Acidobacteria bacterium]|nr:hypothetical protein [Acidobacteriota bacterium]
MSRLASSDIQDLFARLTIAERRSVRRRAISFLRNEATRRSNEKLRSGAVRLLVALLPGTFAAIERVFQDTSSPLWYEIHFTMFAALRREDLSPLDQEQVLKLIRAYLLTIHSDAGFAAWKAGALLGDEWRGSCSLQILGEVLRSATHVAGRKAALHGIEHALCGASEAETTYLTKLIRASSRDDRSVELRRRARAALKGEGCGPRVA